MDLKNAIQASISGIRAQGTRIRVISENIANAQSLATTAGGDPYRRRVVTFAGEVDRATNASLVRVSGVEKDRGEFSQKFDPSHPAADAKGYIKLPNVNVLVETMDMQQAQRSYEANLAAVKAARNMMVRTVDLLSSR